MASAPLEGVGVVNLGVNAPANAACGRLAELGAAVTKVEPPAGDLHERAAPAWYAEVTAGQRILKLDLKRPDDRARLDGLLVEADVLLTSSRPSALARLGLAWSDLADRLPRLVQVAIVGHPEPHQELAGHDLTYVAPLGLLAPPALPRTMLADLGGAERAATTALALLHGRERGGPRYAEVALEDAAAFFAAPLRHGVTAAGGILGGGLPLYGLYAASDGWIALAALEPHFAARLAAELELPERPDAGALAAAFAARPAAEWERWARERDLPLVAVAA